MGLGGRVVVWSLQQGLESSTPQWLWASTIGLSEWLATVQYGFGQRSKAVRSS